MSSATVKVDLESRIGSMNGPSLYPYDKNVTTTLREVPNSKLSVFGYIYEYFVGCLLHHTYDLIVHEPKVKSNGRIVTPDYIIEDFSTSFFIEVKSGEKMNGFAKRLEEYSAIAPTVLIIHREDTAIAKYLQNNYFEGVHVLTDDNLRVYPEFANSSFARSIRNKYDFLKNNSLDNVKKTMNFIEKTYDVISEEGMSKRELYHKLDRKFLFC